MNITQETSIKQLAYTLGKQSNYVMKDYNISKAKIYRVTRGIKHLTFSIILYHSKDLKLVTSEDFIESLALRCNLSNVSSYRNGGFVQFSFQLPEMFHKECLYSMTENKEIGMTDSNQRVQYTFDDSAPQILVTGTSGSGKNYAVASMLLSMNRSEPNTEYCIIDPHNQFYMFDNWVKLAQPIALHGASIDRNIDYLHEKYILREGLRDYEIKRMNRIVGVIDEFESKITDKEQKRKLKDIVVGGRKYKINLIIISQKPTERDMDGMLAGLSQVYIGKVKNKRIGTDLSGWPGLQAHKLAGKGDFIQLYGDKINRFQVAKIVESDFNTLERGQKDFDIPSLPKEVRHKAINDITSDDLITQKKVGRPRRKIKPEVIAYMISNPGVSVRQANESMGLNNNSFYEHKDFTDNLTNILTTVYNKSICDTEND